MILLPLKPAGLLALCLVLSSPSQTVLGDSLRAGRARVDITPTQPVTLSGYASRTELSQGIHDPLSARAVVFESNGNRLALVSLDNIGFYGDAEVQLREAILATTDLKPSELWLCAIHTHSAPRLVFQAAQGHPNNLAYSLALRDRLVELVQSALKDLQPARLGYGSGSSPVGVNRREPATDREGNRSIVLGRNPSVLTDREVQVLKVTRTPDDALAAVLFGYATHSTALGPKHFHISGDVHGLAEQFLENYLGDPIVTPAFAGASGDIDPWHRILSEFKTDRGWIPEPVLMGTMLGEEVVHVLNRIEDLNSAGPVQSVVRTVHLPGLDSEREAAGPDARLPFTVSVGRLGEVAVVGLGGEVFNEIGQVIKQASPAPLTLIITHCNGAAGYVPTRASYPDGGYEIRTSPFAPGADEQLQSEVLNTLNQLFTSTEK